MTSVLFDLCGAYRRKGFYAVYAQISLHIHSLFRAFSVGQKTVIAI